MISGWHAHDRWSHPQSNAPEPSTHPSMRNLVLEVVIRQMVKEAMK